MIDYKETSTPSESSPGVLKLPQFHTPALSTDTDGTDRDVVCPMNMTEWLSRDKAARGWQVRLLSHLRHASAATSFCIKHRHR